MDANSKLNKRTVMLQGGKKNSHKICKVKKFPETKVDNFQAFPIDLSKHSNITVKQACRNSHYHLSYVFYTIMYIDRFAW